jgi:hypothetical protein
LNDLARSTGGAYYGAADGAALTRALTAATITRFPFNVEDATGKVVAEGEAGDSGVDLPAGDYTVTVEAGPQHLTITRVTVAAGQSASVRITRTANGFVIAR